MTSRMARLPQYLDELKNKFGTINCLETGTIRNTANEYREGDGWSTWHIAKWIKHNGGNFMSIDLYTGVADRFLRQKGLQDYVKLVQKDSLQAIAAVTVPLHFVLLDSANDADLILDEFRLVEPKVVKGGIVVIDDVIMDDIHVVKGHKVVPYARKKGYGVMIKDRLAVVRF